jgi:mono/diheme cytochrome c family protein
MSAAALQNSQDRRRVHVLGAISVIAGTLLGVAVFIWIASAGSIQTAGLASSRSSAASVSTLGPPLVERSDNLGQVLFGRYCDSCHPGGRAGIGSDLEGTQVKRQYTSEDKIIKLVRSGGFDMPAFSPSLLSDEDLANIAVYVRNLPAQTR